MARMAVVSDITSIVDNVIEAKPSFQVPGHTLVESDVAGTGDTYTGGKFIPPAPKPPPAPQEVSGPSGRAIMQFHQIEDKILAYIDAIADEKLKLLMRNGYLSVPTFQRNDKMLNVIFAGIGKTSDEVDEYFLEAAALSARG